MVEAAAPRKASFKVVSKLPDLVFCPVCKRTPIRDEENEVIRCVTCGLTQDIKSDPLYALTCRWNSLPRHSISFSDTLAIIALFIVLVFVAWRGLIATGLLYETTNQGLCIIANYCLKW